MRVLARVGARICILHAEAALAVVLADLQDDRLVPPLRPRRLVAAAQCGAVFRVDVAHVCERGSMCVARGASPMAKARLDGKPPPGQFQELRMAGTADKRPWIAKRTLSV